MKKEDFIKIYNQKISILEKCNILNISKTQFYRLVKLYQLEQEKKWLNKDWLYSKYIEENMSAKEIADIFGVSSQTIKRALSEFEILKNEELKRNKSAFLTESFKEKRKETIYSKYGVEHPFQNEDVKQKYKDTMLDKYGVTSPLKNKDIYEKYVNTMINRYGCVTPLKNEQILEKAKETVTNKYSISILENNLSDKVHIRTYEGKPLKDIAKENNLAYTTIVKYLKDKSVISKEEFDFFLKSQREGKTGIEIKISEIFNIDFYNKKILDYRPDFKLNENVYLNVDGLYWHAEDKCDKLYHFNLRKTFEENGLFIFQIREDEILNNSKFEIVKSIIANKLGTLNNKIQARKCLIKQVSQEEAAAFLDKNHLMGKTNAKHIGLFYEDILISLLSYKIFQSTIKIERFCSQINTIVNGGFSKLLKKIETEYPSKSINYWVDLRYGSGKYLENLGFKHCKDTLGFKWTDYKKTYNRLSCKANMDDRMLTQKQYAEELNLHKIFDAGQRLYIKEK